MKDMGAIKKVLVMEILKDKQVGMLYLSENGTLRKLFIDSTCRMLTMLVHH